VRVPAVPGFRPDGRSARCGIPPRPVRCRDLRQPRSGRPVECCPGSSFAGRARVGECPPCWPPVTCGGRSGLTRVCWVVPSWLIDHTHGFHNSSRPGRAPFGGRWPEVRSPVSE